MARWIERLAEIDIEIEHRPGLVHSNVDGVSRPFCKQCEGKVSKTRWIDELQRADELTEPLSVNCIIFLSEITDDQIKELQAEDPDLGHIIEWMKDGQLPTPDFLKSKSLDTRTLWAQVPAIHLLDGILVHKFSDDSMIQLVVPTALRRHLFELTHAGPLAAHLGPQRNLQQLGALYYWPNMNRDIQLWYRQCQICAQAKGPPSRHQARLRKIVTGAPMDIVAADILSGLPVTEDGLRYILVLTDYFTKWVYAFTLPDAEESTCMRVMYDGSFAQFGQPNQLHTHQGRNFESKLFYEMCQLTGIVKKERHLSTHSQMDRPNE